MGFAGLASHTDYAGSAQMAVANFGYGKGIGIVTSGTTGTSYTAGCFVTSTAAAPARRANMAVTFAAVVTPTLASAAQTNAAGLTSTSLYDSIRTVLTNLKASDSATYGSVAAPTVSNIAAPTVTTAGGSASTTAALSAVALVAAAALALKQ